MSGATGAIVPGAAVCREVIQERVAQDQKWGEQNHPDGTGGRALKARANRYRDDCDIAHKGGYGAWSHILLEEVYEAMAESDPEKLREELIQVAAVAVAWAEAIDRRRS